MRIIFMGTPEFAVPTLKALHASDHEVVAVVSSTDKYVGRGKSKLVESAVKQTAIELDIPVLQPKNLKADDFVKKLQSYKADLQVVVAFRMLPVVVWDMPPHGTMNLHASLLPKYRGAAPINWAIIKGEKISGLSTFLLKHEIDTGNVLLQKEIEIGINDTAGDLHDQMMVQGAELVWQSVNKIASGDAATIKQDKRYVSSAPKIKTATCKIDWEQPRDIVHNFIRGLSPYPGAWTKWQGKRLKIFKTDIIEHQLCTAEFSGLFTQEDRLYHSTGSTPIRIMKVQLEGKRRMTDRDFISGYGERLKKE